MLKIYSSFKLFLLALIILLIFIIFFYESTKDDLINYDRITFLHNPLKAYLSVKDFFLYDPNVHDTDVKINKFRNEFADIFNTAINSVSNIMNDRNFYDNIYFYILSKKMAGMDNLVGKFFNQVPSFKDFFIIDSNKNVLYMLSTNTINPGYHDFSAGINSFFTNDYIVIEGKYENPLDLAIEAAAVFDTDVIINKIKEIDIETFFIINGKIYKNSDFSTDFIKDVIKEKTKSKKFISGSRIIEIYPVLLKDSYIGTIGFIYPDRSSEAAILLFFKLLGLLLALVILFIIDRYIVKQLKISKENRKQVKNIEKAGTEEEDDENHLDWLENYVKKTEVYKEENNEK